MGKINLIVLAVSGPAMAGCVSPKVTTSAPVTANFHQFHTVKLVVTESATPTYAREGLPMLETLGNGRAQLIGIALLEADPEIVVNVTGSQSDEAIRMGLISYSVSQIGEFIQNDGREKK